MRRVPSKNWLLGVTFLALFALLFSLPAPNGLSVPGYRALLVALAAVLLWTNGRVPLGVTEILVVLLLALTGAAASLPEALSTGR